MNAITSSIMLDRPAFVPGVFRGMPFEQYHRTEALSASGAKHLLKSPCHYRHAIDHPIKPTEAMQFGTAVHTGVLEPETFDQRIAFAPECDRRTKIGKEIWADFIFQNDGKLILWSDQELLVRGAIAAVRAHPAASVLLDEADSEVSLFWKCDRFGIPRKARMDTTRGGVITDLKTCQDASADAFGKDIAKRLYHVQAANYVEGYRKLFDREPEGYLLIAVESSAPHGVAVYSLPWLAIDAGAQRMDVACERYRDCSASNVWPAYPDTIEIITLPRWAYMEPQA